MKQVLTIPKDASLKGEIKCKGKVKLEGHVEGGGLVEGTVLVSRVGHWVGNIVADVVIIEGAVTGDIVAKQKLLMLPHGKVDGAVYSKNIHMDAGASVTGKVQMNTPAPLGLQIDPSNYVPVDLIQSDENPQQDLLDTPEIETPRPAAYNNSNVVVL